MQCNTSVPIARYSYVVVISHPLPSCSSQGLSLPLEVSRRYKYQTGVIFVALSAFSKAANLTAHRSGVLRAFASMTWG